MERQLENRNDRQQIEKNQQITIMTKVTEEMTSLPDAAGNRDDRYHGKLTVLLGRVNEQKIHRIIGADRTGSEPLEAEHRKRFAN